MTDILITDSSSVTDVGHQSSLQNLSQVHHAQCPQYVSLDCLCHHQTQFSSGDSVETGHSRTSSLSGANHSSSSSGHHSRASTVSSSASIGGLFESKSCDSLLEESSKHDDESIKTSDNNNDITMVTNNFEDQLALDQDPQLISQFR